MRRKKKNDNNGYKNKRWQRRERKKKWRKHHQPTSAVPLTFDPKAGEVADSKQNPLMDLFNIPSNNNMQTLTQLHKELTHTIQKRKS
jgi:hypothetical protein